MTGASDRIVRIFTRSKERFADDALIQQFEESIKQSSIPQQSMGYSWMRNCLYTFRPFPYSSGSVLGSTNEFTRREKCCAVNKAFMPICLPTASSIKGPEVNVRVVPCGCELTSRGMSRRKSTQGPNYISRTLKFANELSGVIKHSNVPIRTGCHFTSQ